MGVGAPRDRCQALGTVVHGIHRGHHGKEHLGRADVGGRLLTADVLLAGLQGQAVGRRAVSVDGDAHEASRERPLEPGAHAHVAGVGAAKAHRNTEALGRAHRDIGAPLPRRRGQGQCQQVCGGRDQGAGVVRSRGEGAPVAQLAVASGVLHEDAKDVAVSCGRAQLLRAPHSRDVSHHDVDAERDRPGVHDGPGLREDMLVDEEDRVGRCLAGAAHERHGLRRRGALVEQGRARRGQRGEVADHRLEVEERLEAALGDLRLVGRVGGVPRRVLEHVALDDRGREGVVVAEPDHRGRHVVEAGDGAQLLDHGRLGRGRVDVQGLLGADDAGDCHVGEGVQALLPDGLEHVGDISL